MNTQQFLDLVLPDESEGVRIIGALANGSKQFRHTVHRTNADAAASVARIASEGLNAYHAMAAYKQGFYTDAAGKQKLRTHENANSLKSLWFDIDVKPGDEKCYQTRDEAVAALLEFCVAHALPKPMLVGSGRYGVHAYWVLDDSISVATWKPLAERLKKLAMHHGLLADHACTADAARVLRPVGAINMKLGQDAVQLLTRPRTHRVDDLTALLVAASDKAGVSVSKPVPNDGLLGAAPAHVPQGGATNTDVKYDALPVSLPKVLQHCALLSEIALEGGQSCPEPLWYATMGIAAYTSDIRGAVVTLAGQHPDFDEEGSLARAVRWKEKATGPTTCERLRALAGSACGACPHNGKITTPLQLGRVVDEAPQPILTDAETGLATGFTIPNPPHPYKRSNGKGVYYELENESGVSTPVQICPFDIYPARLQECERKEEYNVVWRVTLPHTGVRDITLPSRLHASECGKLMGELAAKGVPVQPKNAKVMQEYMMSYIRELQEAAPAARQFARLGWRSDGTFVTPSGLCTPTGFMEFPSVQPFLRGFKGLWHEGKGLAIRGSTEGWKECLKFYDDRRCLSHRMFFLLSAAAPLLHFTNVKGLHVNAVGESGSGKTSVSYVVAGMWGHPTEYCINGTKQGATLFALFRNISLRNTLPVVIDEISNWKGEYAGEFCYSISQGVGRERMNGSESFAQAETWNTIASSSSNQPIGGKIGAYKADSHAEQMRLLEFRVEKDGVHEKWEADAMLRKLHENYGTAGPDIMQFIVANQDAVRSRLHKTMEQFDKMASIESNERYWSSGIACALVMGSIMRKLGMISWDLDELAQFGVKLVEGSRTQAVTDNGVSNGLFSTLLDTHSRDTMILAGAPQTGNLGTSIETPLQRPSGKLLIRKEFSTGMLYVATSLIRSYCQDNNLDIKTLEEEVAATGALLDKQHRKVLGAGTIEGGGQVRCWKVDWRLLV